jgi:uncharacterized membrane-anchored protein
VVANDTSTLPQQRGLFNKVAEVTIWFWIIKILCTTVGESFADWINTTLGVGLEYTSLLFTVVLITVLAWQMRLIRYVPFAYWLTVVVLSVTGTLYTDILTDDLNVPLGVSTTVFATALGAVFGIWYAREGTLSIKSIYTIPREAFYWLAVLVTFALGTAAGDWTLELTGWDPGVAVLLPIALLVAVYVGWRLGANAVLSFWLAYVLTRPLGANLGDWIALPSADGGLGLGTALTSLIFLGAILGTVIYLTVSRRDVTEERRPREPRRKDPRRERTMLGYFAAVIVIAGLVLAHASAQPHSAAAASEDDTSAPAAASSQALTPTQLQHFPAAELAKLKLIVTDTLAKVQAGDQAGAKTRIKDLETGWDEGQSALQPLDQTAWHVLDGEIDTALTAVRASKPDASAEAAALIVLGQSLG